jgi:iron complex outermembrane receptor protein
MRFIGIAAFLGAAAWSAFSVAADEPPPRDDALYDTVPVAPSVDGEADALPAPTPATDVTALPNVIVTGELITRTADQTTSSVAVQTGAEIERSTARDIYAVIRATPNAGLEDSDYGFGGMTLRGIGSYGASGAGAYASYGTTNVVVIDGVALPRSALSYADLSAFDLDTVEIFRGPQSTSQGRNAMGGAVVINSVTPEPWPGFGGQIRGRVAGGDFGQRHYAGAAEATLWPDVLALRGVYDDRRDHGDVRNATRSDDHAAFRDNRSLRLRTRLRPGGAGSAYEVIIGVADIEHARGSTYVQLAHEHDRIALNDQPQDFDNRARLYSIDQRLQLADAWTLRAVSAWFRSKTLSRFDTDYGADDGGATIQHEDSDGFSQELRLSYAGQRLRGTIGAYFYDESNRDDSNGYIGIASLIGAGGLPLGNIVFESGLPSAVRDIAVFGELDWDASDRLTLTAGLRADREDNERVFQTAYSGDSLTANVLVASLRGTVLPADGEVPVSREFSDVLPKFAARYELFDDWFLGAAYVEGYRPGGDGYNQVSGRHFSFDAERTRNTELSLKGTHRPWRLQAALNLFHTRWDDMQVQGGEGIDNYMENAGRATIRGGELALRWRAVDALQVLGGVGVTHGRFDRYVSTQGYDYAGNRLPKAPAYSGMLALEWMPLPDLLIRPDLLWVGATPANADNNPVHELPAYRLLNLAVRWQVGPVGLFFTGTNLPDEQYRKDANNYGSAGYDVVSLGEQRRLMGGLEFAF